MSLTEVSFRSLFVYLRRISVCTSMVTWVYGGGGGNDDNVEK